MIPNGINEARFAEVPTRDDAKANLGLDGKIILGFTGFVRDWHGLDRVLEFLAGSAQGNLHLLLVGDGPARENLEATAQRLNVADIFTVTGIVAREQIASYVASFDIALQPSVVAYASPLKLFEYLALGHAIVAPATANIMEILQDDRNALLFEPDSEQEFFACVRRLLDDDALRETIAERRLTWVANAERVLALYARLGARNAPAVASAQREQ